MNENRNRSSRILLISCVLTLLFFPLGYFLLSQQADWPEVKIPVLKLEPSDIQKIPDLIFTETRIAKINRSGTSKTAMLVSVPRFEDESIVIEPPPDGILCGGEFYLNKNGNPDGYDSWELDVQADITNLNDIKTCIQYPDSLRMVGFEGDVFLRVKIGKAGDIEGIEVRRSTHPLFSEMVLKCMKNAKGKAGTLDGQPVKSWVVVPFKFRIQR